MRTFLFFLAAAIMVGQSQPAPTVQPKPLPLYGKSPLPPLTPRERLRWITISTIGPANLAAGMVTSAYSTGTNSPPEYGPHWDGWGKRQGLRVTGSAASNLMEAGMGALWGEDPRYHAAPTREFKGRVMHVIKTTFLSYDRNGNQMPAYARFIAVPGSNILSNTWRPDSQRTVSDTSWRIGYGFAGRMGSNAFAEFWPDIKRLVFKKK